jgi:hypothetical protein
MNVHVLTVQRPADVPGTASTSTPSTKIGPASPSTPKKKGSSSALGTPFTPRAKGTTFASAVPVTPSNAGGLKGGMTTLDELQTHRVLKLPDECEVTDERLQDPLLRQYYLDLPNLR